MQLPAVGDQVELTLSLDPATIRSGAELVGDYNPLHHDEAVAASSRFGGLIASGAHTSALLAGVISRGFHNKATTGDGNAGDSYRGAVGVDYSVRFVAPVRANRSLRLEWRVVALEKKSSGIIARMEGSIVDTVDSATLVTGKMTILYFN